MRNITKLGLLPAATVATMTTMAMLNTGVASAADLSKGGIDLSILGNDCPTGMCSDLATGGYNVNGAPVVGNFPNEAKIPGTDTGLSGFDEADTSAQVKQYNVASILSDPAGAVEELIVTGLDGAFDFLWGSVDTYNQIEFFSGDDSQAIFSGIDIAGILGATPANDQGNYHFDAYVNFLGDFDRAVLTNVVTGETSDETRIAFEVATDVPEPASLLGLAVVGLVSGSTLLSRKKQAV
ncbi:MAG: PEP-CTERM sorting domain-containing protein [Leptolyngbya sp. SIOISBB]|nr:PEP-CTERM sorting domain-containing protein [Leptolyngbya sp. SIOISBB]